MELRDAVKLYNDIKLELAGKGLVMPQGWILTWDNARRRFGQCRYGRKEISLSRNFVSLNTPERVGQTIRHEIAHALVGGGHGHDSVWVAMSLRCGDDGVRCYNTNDTETPKLSYEAVCKGCSKVYSRSRAPKAFRPASSCGECCRTFNPTYVLDFKRVR